MTSADGFVDHGVIMGEGGGTVNLLSSGYMCSHAWKRIPRYNPSNISVIVHEMPHEPDRFSPAAGRTRATTWTSWGGARSTT